MAIPAGVSSNNTLIPEKSLGNENFDKLFESISTLVTTSQNIRGNTSRVASSLTTRTSSIDLNPTADKIVSLTELNTVIPSGFLLLHNDLAKLIQDDRGPASTSFSLLSLMKNLLVVVGGAAIVGGIVKGIFSGNSESDKDHLNGIISALNLKLSVKDFEKDPDVLAAQKAAFIGYLKAYYLQQEASMLVSGTLEAIGEGAGKAVQGFFTSLFNIKTEENETPSKLDTLITTLINGLDTDTLIKDQGVLDARKKGFISYLTTYFVTQTAAMADETLLASVGIGAGKLVGGIFSGIWDGLTGQDSQKTVLKTIIESLLSLKNISISDYTGDADIKAALFGGVKGYLKTYFASQTTAMTLKTTTKAVGAAAGNIAVGTLTSLIETVAGWFGADTRSPLEVIIDDLLASIDSEDYTEDEEVLAAEKESVISALKAYFASQTEAMTLEDTAKAVGASVVDVAKGALINLVESVAGIFGYEGEESPLEAIIEGLTDNLDIKDYQGDKEIEALKKEAVASAVKAYFQAQIDSMVMEEEAGAKGSSFAEKGISFVEKVWNWGTGKDDSTPLERAVASIVSQEIDVSEYEDSEEIKEAKERVLAESISAILDIEKDSITSLYTGRSTSFLNNNLDFTNFVTGIGDIISYNLTPALYEGPVQSTKQNAVRDIIGKILAKENNFIASKYSTRLTAKVVAEKLSSISNDYLEFLTSTVSSKSFSGTSSVPVVDVNSQYDQKVSGDVESIKGYVITIKNFLSSINDNVNKIRAWGGNTTSTTTVVKSESGRRGGQQDPYVNGF